ncbi:MAG: AAA family ATPase [Pseudomonas sp.]
MHYFVVISGCSGGGKSTLLAELHRQGHAIVEEPGRRIVQGEAQTGGQALPWIDMAAFLRRALATALDDHKNARADKGKWVFFDRGLVDASAALQELTGEPLLASLGQLHRYHRRVFLAPPWPEIYGQDAERRHDMHAALAEYERLQKAYPELGYEVFLLPKASVQERVDFVLSTLAGKSPCAAARV